MQFRPSGASGQMPVFAQRLIPFLIIVVQALATSESMQDTLGSELISRVSLTSDTLGELGDASADVDAPEQLTLPALPKARAPTPMELALVQSKVSHKDVSTKRLRAGHRQPDQAALAKVWEKSSKDQAEAADTDVEQLGGQVNEIMSELDDSAPVDDKAQNGKNALDQAKAMEQAADSGDDAAMEKEVTETAKQKDDSQNIMDGAMAYIRTRLAGEEHKSLRLRQLLSQSVRGNKKMREKIEQLRKQAEDNAVVEKSWKKVAAAKVEQEEAALAKQTKRADTSTGELKNATRAAKIGEKSMKVLGMKLKYAKSQVAALLLNLANASQTNKDLTRRLTSTDSNATTEAKQLASNKKLMTAEEKDLAETKAALKKLQKDKAAEDTKMKLMERQNDLLKQREGSATTRDKILHKENTMLKTQLAAEIQRAEQLREMWSKESEAFTWQLRAERANASESLSDLEKARNEFKDLRDRVKQLRERASHGEKSRHAAEDAANKASFALAQAEAENKQLKGSVPWLEAEVDREKEAVQNATKDKAQALKERDTVKAILGEAQKNIVQLQGQYADALQALVVAQAGGSADASKQQAVVDNLEQPLGMNPLGSPPPVSSDPNVADDASGSSLLELSRDSKSLNNIMTTNKVTETRGKVDLSKDSGGLTSLLRGMNGAHQVGTNSIVQSTMMME